jgi:predicted nucleic acid-binding Zn ribbon protein
MSNEDTSPKTSCLICFKIYEHHDQEIKDKCKDYVKYVIYIFIYSFSLSYSVRSRINDILNKSKCMRRIKIHYYLILGLVFSNEILSMAKLGVFFSSKYV